MDLRLNRMDIFEYLVCAQCHGELCGRRSWAQHAGLTVRSQLRGGLLEMLHPSIVHAGTYLIWCVGMLKPHYNNNNNSKVRKSGVFLLAETSAGSTAVALRIATFFSSLSSE